MGVHTVQATPPPKCKSHPQRLNTELDNLRKGVTDPVVQECKRLRQQLKSEAALREELAGRLEVASNDNAQLRRERKRLDEKLAHVHGCAPVALWEAPARLRALRFKRARQPSRAGCCVLDPSER